jgi:hypothetical protein
MWRTIATVHELDELPDEAEIRVAHRRTETARYWRVFDVHCKGLSFLSLLKASFTIEVWEEQ